MTQRIEVDDKYNSFCHSFTSAYSCLLFLYANYLLDPLSHVSHDETLDLIPASGVPLVSRIRKEGEGDMFLRLRLLLVFIFVVLQYLSLHDVEAFVPFHLSVMPAGPAANDEGIFDFKLVDHIDQLDQRHSLRGPRLFSIPAPGGNVCLVIDERGAYHALRDSCPPMGLPISDSGVVDTEVKE